MKELFKNRIIFVSTIISSNITRDSRSADVESVLNESSSTIDESNINEEKPNLNETSFIQTITSLV